MPVFRGRKSGAGSCMHIGIVYNKRHTSRKAGVDVQKRIRQIAAGKFESDQPSLSISDEELFLTVTEGQEYTGEFEITSENHIR